jgi:hypothetical protein
MEIKRQFSAMDITDQFRSTDAWFATAWNCVQPPKVMKALSDVFFP